MPYVVTTKRRDVFDVNGPEYDIWTVLSRLAVATLKEAWRICDDAFAACPGYAENFTLLVPGESGGTVGPLPDGTVIEVGQEAWKPFIEANWPPNSWATVWRMSEAARIDAFNARKASA